MIASAKFTVKQIDDITLILFIFVNHNVNTHTITWVGVTISLHQTRP